MLVRWDGMGWEMGGLGFTLASLLKGGGTLGVEVWSCTSNLTVHVLQKHVSTFNIVIE